MTRSELFHLLQPPFLICWNGKIIILTSLCYGENLLRRIKGTNAYNRHSIKMLAFFLLNLISKHLYYVVSVLLSMSGSAWHHGSLSGLYFSHDCFFTWWLGWVWSLGHALSFPCPLALETIRSYAQCLFTTQGRTRSVTVHWRPLHGQSLGPSRSVPELLPSIYTCTVLVLETTVLLLDASESQARWAPSSLDFWILCWICSSILSTWSQILSTSSPPCHPWFFLIVEGRCGA